MSQLPRPRGARVLIKKAWEDEVRESGIVLPANARERPQRGVVVAVGPGARDFRSGEIVPIDGLAAGDRVTFLKYAGYDIKVGEDTDYILIDEKDVGLVWPDDG
jgi:chaperonin GroES